MKTGIMGQRGFTLLEVLMAISISAGVLFITLAAIRAGLSSWKKGEEAVLRSSMKMTLAQRLSKELSSIYPYTKSADEGGMAFQGGDSEIGFVTSASGASGLPWGGFRHIRYSVKQGSLIASENTVPGPLDRGVDNVIAAGVEKIAFSYLGETGWEQAWDVELRKALPREIRVEIRFAGQDRPFVLRTVPGITAADTPGAGSTGPEG